METAVEGVIVVVVCGWMCVGMDGWWCRDRRFGKSEGAGPVVFLRRGPVSGGWLRQVT